MLYVTLIVNGKGPTFCLKQCANTLFEERMYIMVCMGVVGRVIAFTDEYGKNVVSPFRQMSKCL